MENSQQLNCSNCNSSKTFRFDNIAHCAECGQDWDSVGEDYDTVAYTDAYGDVLSSQDYDNKVRYWTGVALGRN